MAAHRPAKRYSWPQTIWHALNHATSILMAPLPDSKPHQISLGPLEKEILDLLWQAGAATVKDIHDQILTDPDRELAYASVTTVLRRLQKKGWVTCDKRDRAFLWHPRISREEAQIVQAHDRLQRFLAVGNPDVVAAFADSLDRASAEQFEAIAERIRHARQQRKEGK